MIPKRRQARVIKIGDIRIGGSYPVAIQSMLKTKTADIKNALHQIKSLESLGCEIVRVAVKDNADAEAIGKLKPKVKIPIVADIHFSWRLALRAIDNGADKIRLNPGNIYKKDQIREVVSAARLNGIPIRIGVNSGSLRQARTNTGTMVKSVLDYIRILEGLKFYNLVLSLKASGVRGTVEAYRKIARLCDYPLHLGTTATGLPAEGAIKSSIAIGALLLEGIGDTIRVSLTERPEEEVRVAKNILEAVGLRSFGPQIISCPTCGRCEVDLKGIVKGLEGKLHAAGSTLYARPIKVAVMGCTVNGPGEAKEADLGIAFGKKEGLLFKAGRPVKKIAARACAEILLKEIAKEQR